MINVKKDKNQIEIEYDGDAHTVLNILKRKLLENKDVEFVGYNKPHPLLKESVLVVRTKKDDPKKVVKNSIDEINKELKEALLK